MSLEVQMYYKCNKIHTIDCKIIVFFSKVTSHSRQVGECISQSDDFLLS